MNNNIEHSSNELRNLKDFADLSVERCNEIESELCSLQNSILSLYETIVAHKEESEHLQMIVTNFVMDKCF